VFSIVYIPDDDDYYSIYVKLSPTSNVLYDFLESFQHRVPVIIEAAVSTQRSILIHSRACG
jgi:hypothetical protein